MAKRPRAPSSRRYAYTPELMAHGRHRYEHTEDSIPDIAVEFGIHKTTLQRLANREGWVRYAAPPRDVSAATKLAERAAALEAGMQETSIAPPTPDPSPPFAAQTGGGETGAERDAPTPAAGATAAAIDAEIEALLVGVQTERAIYQAMRARMKHLPQSPLEAERTTRALSQLTATLHRIQRLRAGHIDITPEDLVHDNDNANVATDIDARRDELAHRIRAFFESRRGAQPAAGSSDER